MCYEKNYSTICRRDHIVCIAICVLPIKAKMLLEKNEMLAKCRAGVAAQDPATISILNGRSCEEFLGITTGN